MDFIGKELQMSFINLQFIFQSSMIVIRSHIIIKHELKGFILYFFSPLQLSF